jgi:hypothetical protein
VSIAAHGQVVAPCDEIGSFPYQARSAREGRTDALAGASRLVCDSANGTTTQAIALWPLAGQFVFVSGTLSGERIVVAPQPVGPDPVPIAGNG